MYSNVDSISHSRVVARALLALLMLATVSFAWAGSAYQLKEGDLINISVWGEENLRQESRVLPDGSVSFPLVGSIVVKGMSTAEVEAAIAKGVGEFIPDPEVSVVVSATEGNRVFILGKVGNPGAIVMTAPMNVMQALSLSGGLATFADENKILVLRGTAKGQSPLEVRYRDILSGKDLSTNHQLEAGDTILVP